MAGRQPLSVALVWHMHQPYYRDDVSGQMMLPWVRKRAAKDYLHMIDVAARHPELRITMNMVPSLLEQLALYDSDEIRDSHRDLVLRDAATLTDAERRFLIDFTLTTEPAQRVASHAPFTALRQEMARGGHVSIDDLRDCQVWTMLAWFDPRDAAEQPALAALLQRGRGFTEADKVTVDRLQLQRVRRVIPRYAEEVAAGRIEPMTTPLHHPILPLLCDAEVARIARPGIPLPAGGFRHPHDAHEQLRRGLERFTQRVGRRPDGIWPAECSVSPEALGVLAAGGVQWAISDEGVLARTVEAPVRGDRTALARLYRPWRDQSGTVMVFRDAVLSNRIGFDYPRLSAADAVADLVGELESIAALKPASAAWLVTIALDGENCWEFYEENGNPFLDGLYDALTSHPALRSVHVGDFLARNPRRVARLPRIWSGSWIDADFTTWIGDATHNRAWELLGAARTAVAAAGIDAHPQAYDELLIAEASDWYWWFGPHHDSGVDAAWDALFRTHIANAYRLASLPVPPVVEKPILPETPLGHDVLPLRALDPVAHGEREWRAAGVVSVGAVFGAMQPARSSVEQIRYGAGGGRLHLDFGPGAAFESAVIDAGEHGLLELQHATRHAAVAIPGDRDIDFSVTLRESGRGIEHVPAEGSMHLHRPRTGGGRRIALVAVECAPIASAGDLGVIVAETATAFEDRGHECLLVIPWHRDSHLPHAAIRTDRLEVPFAGRSVAVQLLQGSLPGARVPVLAIDSPQFFNRDAIYGAVDDDRRYAFFAAAVAQTLEATAFDADSVICFEWQSALVPALLSAHGHASRGYVTRTGRAEFWTASALVRDAGLPLSFGADEEVELYGIGAAHAARLSWNDVGGLLARVETDFEAAPGAT